MTTAQLSKTEAPFTIAPITYEVQKELIQKLADEYLPLTVASVHDKAGLDAVRSARIKVKTLRVNIEKRRKELKAESLEYGRRVDSAAKELTALIEPIESHLENEEGIVAREQERIKREAEEKRQAITRERLRLLTEAGAMCLPQDVESLSLQDFGALLDTKQAEKKLRDEQAAREEAERQRIAEEQRIEAARLAKEREELERHRREQEAVAAEQRRQEEAKLADERAELDRQRKEQAEAQAKIDAEKKRIADEEAERVRRAELAKAQEVAAERARQEEIARQQREVDAAKAKAEAEELERQRLEALRPDREKLLAVASALESIEVPAVSKSAAQTAVMIEELIDVCVGNIRDAVERQLGK